MSYTMVGASWLLPLVFGILALSAMLVCMRLLRGPSSADRVVAIDALTLLGVGVVSLMALASGQSVLLDVAVVLALMSFLGTAAFALMLRAPTLPAAQAPKKPPEPLPSPTAGSKAEPPR